MPYLEKVFRWLALGLVGCVAVVILWKESQGGDLLGETFGARPDASQGAEHANALKFVRVDGDKPEDSVATSETEVITFDSILSNRDMSRSERIAALKELGPGALRKAPNGAPSKAPEDATLPDANDTGGDAEPDTSDKYALAAARRRVEVTMYSTSWCGVCKRAKKYFNSQGVTFKEHDVDADDAARAAYLQLNPRRTVPTIVVDGRVLVGFSPSGFERLMNQAAEAHL